jgi:hypothetical protein
MPPGTQLTSSAWSPTSTQVRGRSAQSCLVPLGRTSSAGTFFFVVAQATLSVLPA